MIIVRDLYHFTDIHGSRPLFDAIMNYCHEQDPEATIIFGGDAIDRGRDGYAIMKELLDNPYVIYLKGNHEDMFCKAAREIKQKLVFENFEREHVKETLRWCRAYDYRYENIQLSLGNGGLDTLTDWVVDGMPMDIIERVEHLPLTFSYGKCDFCHSAGVYRTFKEAADAEYEGVPVDDFAAEMLIWGRTALDIGWEPNRIAVFGHTPTPYLADYTDVEIAEDNEIMPVMYTVNDLGWKLDMDTGAVFTGRAYVLNVLTMKAYGFEDKDFNNSEIHKHNVEQIEVIQF